MNKIFLSALCFLSLEVAKAATIGQEIASPVTTKAAPWFWSGVAATAVLIATEDSVSDPATKEVSDDKPIGDLSRLGDLNGQMIPNALYVMGMWAHSKFSENQTSMNRAEHMTKATIYAALATTVLKYTVREPRPDNSQEKILSPRATRPPPSPSPPSWPPSTNGTGASVPTPWRPLPLPAA